MMLFSECPNLAVPANIMQHIVHVESHKNPYAIGVVGAKLVRQPRNLVEAVATAQMLEQKGYNFFLGLAQVNRHNMIRYGLKSYMDAFDICNNVQAGSYILRECYDRSGSNWGKSFSCYYSGNFTTGYKHGYVQKIAASMQKERNQQISKEIPNSIALVNHPVSTSKRSKQNANTQILAYNKKVKPLTPYNPSDDPIKEPLLLEPPDQESDLHQDTTAFPSASEPAMIQLRDKAFVF